MCAIELNHRISLVAKKNFQGTWKTRKLEYYLVLPTGEKYYTFTRNYSTACYEMFKSGKNVNAALRIRSANTALMNLVKYMKHIMPYLAECYGLHIVV